MSFKPVTSQVNFAQQEAETIQYWKENKIFEKSVSSRPSDKRWTFLDGPPFVTGMPHYGSLLSSLPKDLFGRYWTMKGYRVRRVWGRVGAGWPQPEFIEVGRASARLRMPPTQGGLEPALPEAAQLTSWRARSGQSGI